MRVSLPVALLLTLLCGVAIAAWSRATENAAHAGLQLKAELTATVLAQAAAEMVWNFDKDGAAAVLRAARADPDYAGSEIVGLDGALFVRIGASAHLADLTVSVPISRLGHLDPPMGELRFTLTTARTDATITQQRRLALAFGGGSLLIASVALAVILRTVIRPITGLTETMVRLSGGDQAVVVPLQRRSDELGAMARTVEVFKRNVITVQRLRAERAAEAERAAAVRRDLLHGMAETFERDVAARLDQVSAMAAESHEIALTMVTRIAESEAGAGSVAVVTAQTAHSVQSVAAVGQEMSASTDEMAGRVASSAESARAAAEASVAAAQTIANLAEEAQRIGSVVEAIQAIANQTKLLSLNASIEAARAGASGRGFAVVASEVKSLAAQTAEETMRIARQVHAMQAASKRVVAEIGAIAEASERSNLIAAEIAGSMEQQSVAMRHIAQNVSTASEGTSSVSRTIGTMSGAIGVVREAAQTILTAHTALTGQVAELQANVRRFVSDVRAA